ncbi:MAG: bacillithiol biosynthesis cysteine-adding enzyme BshC [Chloracidobacterium sp.]
MPSLSTLEQTLTTAAAHRLARYPPLTRQTLSTALQEQNLRWQAAPQTLANLDRLAEASTVAIVTGQQAGLLGGPALTIWKILTAIKLAQNLAQRGQSSVPVFWMASEDHDFDEVEQTTILAPDGTLQTLTCRPSFVGHPAVGEVELDASIEQMLNTLASALPTTEFTSGIFEDLRASYLPGRKWCDAFAHWLHRLFAPFGLIIVDPRDERLRTITQPVFEAIIQRTPDITNRLVQQAQAYQAQGKSPQVSVIPSSTTLFLDIDGNRTPLVLDGYRFRPKSNVETSYTKEDLLRILRAEPLRLTPSALLRPVIQDTLFPTVVQVVGPAEMAYLSQSEIIYEAVGIQSPIRWPRASVTLVEQRHAKVFAKLGLTPDAAALGKPELLRRAALQSNDAQIIEYVNEVKVSFGAQLDRLKQLLQEADPSLAEALDRGREKIFHQLNGLEQRFFASYAQRDAARTRQIERAITALTPHGQPQERVLNILSFLVKYGPSLLTHSYTKIDFQTTDHQWILLEPGRA